MKGFVRFIKKVITCSLLILFLGYESSTTLFQHKHIIDGLLVTHSHPYSDNSKTGEHTHTPYEFITIVALSVMVISAVLFDFIVRLFPIRLLKRADSENRYPFIHYFPTLSLRGPPVL